MKHSSDKKFKVIVVDDHSFFRKGVILVVNRFENFEVIGEASNGAELLTLLLKLTPDLILMDIKMPVMEGVEATREVLKNYPDVKIIAFSMFGDEKHLESMINAGIQGFILKNIECDDLEKAICRVANDQQYFSEEFLPYFTNKYLGVDANNDASLTKRELEILQLVAQGLSNREIADKLSLSIRTITSHRANINSKTGSRNTVNLLTYAIQHKLISIS